MAERFLSASEMYPAGQTDVSAGFVRTRSGRRIRFAAAGDPKARPMLLLHGWGCSLYAFRHLFAGLASRGFRAIAVDQLGHGLSDKPTDPSEYSLQRVAASTCEIVDALQLDNFDVLGHSMGGRVAIELARELGPERIGRLLLLNSVGLGPMPHVTVASRVLIPSLASAAPVPLPSGIVKIPIAAVYGGTPTFTPEDIEQYRAPTQFREFLMASLYLLKHFDWSEISAEIREQILPRSWVMLGELDRVVRTVRAGRDRKLVAEGWRVSVLRGVAHVPHEESPQEVLRFVDGDSIAHG